MEAGDSVPTLLSSSRTSSSALTPGYPQSPCAVDAALWANFLCFVRRLQGYMRPNEKWKVANAALKIFHEVRSHPFSL